MDPPQIQQPTQPSTAVAPVPNRVSHPPLKIMLRRHAVLILVVLIALSIFLTGLFAYLYVREHKKNTASPPQATTTVEHGNASISGDFDINGPIPSGATISVLVRKVGETTFATALPNIPAVDGGSWHWYYAAENQAYDIRGVLNAGGQTVATSKDLTVVAPADSEALVFNIENQQVAASQTSAAVTGSIDLNGYIPAGSTVSILAQATGESGFTTVVSGVPAVNGSTWTYAGATSGTTYSLQASLVSGGSTVSTSNTLTVAAPATNEVLTINSSATPPAPTNVSVSGTVNLNGTVPSGSTLTFSSRPSGTTTFTTFASNVTAVDGASWTFNGTAGQSYDFQAYIQANGTTTNQSQILTVTAPATNEVLTINAQTQPPAPGGNSITNTCVGKNSSTNLWQVQLTYNTNNAETNAQQYLLTIGNTQGGNQQLNQTSGPNNTSQPSAAQSYTTGFLFTEGQTYYAQWAYATCSNCNTFSQFSPSIQFYCTTPNPTSTPTPSLTPVPTNTPVPSATSAPTPTNAPTNTPTTAVPTPTPTSS